MGGGLLGAFSGVVIAWMTDLEDRNPIGLAMGVSGITLTLTVTLWVQAFRTDD